MFIGSQDLSTFSNDQNTIISIEEFKQVVRVRYDVSRRVLIRGYGVDLYNRVSVTLLGKQEKLHVQVCGCVIVGRSSTARYSLISTD